MTLINKHLLVYLVYFCKVLNIWQFSRCLGFISEQNEQTECAAFLEFTL